MEEIKAYLSDNVFKGSFLSMATIHEYAEKLVNEANYESLKCFKANTTGEDIRGFYYMPYWAQRKLERKLREDKQKFKDLRDFLSDSVFEGRNLDTEDIDSYVHGLYEAGFQSVDELKLDLNDQNIEGLLWMPPNRRAVLMAKVKEVRGKN